MDNIWLEKKNIVSKSYTYEASLRLLNKFRLLKHMVNLECTRSWNKSKRYSKNLPNKLDNDFPNIWPAWAAENSNEVLSSSTHNIIHMYYATLNFIRIFGVYQIYAGKKEFGIKLCIRANLRLSPVILISRKGLTRNSQRARLPLHVRVWNVKRMPSMFMKTICIRQMFI